MKHWTDNEDTLLRNLLEDGCSDKKIYESDLNRAWPLIKIRAKKLGLDLSCIPDGRLLNNGKKKTKTPVPAIPAITGTDKIHEWDDCLSMALLREIREQWREIEKAPDPFMAFLDRMLTISRSQSK